MAVDLFSIFATIGFKDNGFSKGLDAAAQAGANLQKNLAETTSKIETGFSGGEKATAGLTSEVSKLGDTFKNEASSADELVKATDNASSALEKTKTNVGNLGIETDNATEKNKNFAENLKNNVVKAAEVTVAALTVVATTFGLLATKSLMSSGELEQQLGGSEAVWGRYAQTIQNKGKEAYNSMGLSQSEFLATANKMGSLMQGAGVSTTKSVELTTAAMQRAADVASIMGIDIEFAMESVAGAAKGNFTMMDNLGKILPNKKTMNAISGVCNASKQIIAC